MKLDLGKIFFLILFLTLSVMAATAGTIKGTITDRQTKEPLTGATVQVSGTAQGAVADLDGNYTLELKNGTGQSIRKEGTSWDARSIFFPPEN